jgi:hypothetical protein
MKIRSAAVELLNADRQTDMVKHVYSLVSNAPRNQGVDTDAHCRPFVRYLYRRSRFVTAGPHENQF